MATDRIKKTNTPDTPDSPGSSEDTTNEDSPQSPKSEQGAGEAKGTKQEAAGKSGDTAKDSNAAKDTEAAKDKPAAGSKASEKKSDSETTKLAKDGEDSKRPDAKSGKDGASSAADSPKSPDSAESETDDDDLPPYRPTGSSGGGLGAATGAIISAALGLCSLTGTSLSEMIRERKSLIGQIEAQGGGGDVNQIEAFYGAPWHASALINGAFGLVALAIGAVVALAIGKRTDSRVWVKALAIGGAVLGALGLLLAGGMYFDIIADQPEMPSTPPTAPQAP